MIDLKALIKKYPNCLENSSKLRSYLVDLYPQEKRSINIIVTIMECGIAEKIKQSPSSIDELTLNSYCTHLENEYAVSGKYAKECLVIWAKAYDKAVVLSTSKPQQSPKAQTAQNQASNTANLFNTGLINNSINSAFQKYGLQSTTPAHSTTPGLNIVNGVLYGVGSPYVKKLIVPNTVKRIAKDAFKGNKALISVELSNSVEVIENGAFANCSNVETIIFPSSIKKVGTGAFQNCAGLKKLFIDDLVAWCNIDFDSLTANPIYYATEFVVNGTVLLDLAVPDGVFEIKKFAFNNYFKLRSVVFSSTVKSIGESAFECCYSLGSVRIPKNIEVIGGKAFYNCSRAYISLEKPIPQGTDAFFNCRVKYDFMDNNYPANSVPANSTIASKAKANSQQKSKRELKKSHKYLIAFAAITAAITFFVLLGTVFVPLSHYNSGKNALEAGNYVEAYKEYSQTNWKDSAEQKGNARIAGLQLALDQMFLGNKDDAKNILKALGYQSYKLPSISELVEELNISELVIPNGTKSIPSYALYRCKTIKSVTIPDSVVTIEERAFSDCENLSKVSFSNNITNIGEYAFAGCKKLTSVTLPDSVISIEYRAFYYCGLMSITVPNGVTKIGNEAFEGSDLKSIKFGKNSQLTSIGYRAFNWCNHLTSVTIPDSVKSIGDLAFNYCPIRTVTMPATAISSIPKSSLNTVVITSGKSIDESAFSGCTSLRSIIIPNSVTNIGDSAFSGCSGLTSISIPNSVTSISNNAFTNCSNLKYNEYDNAYYLGNSETPLLVLVKAKSTDITTIEINDSTKHICNNAFIGCNNLTSIYYLGDISSWIFINGLEYIITKNTKLYINYAEISGEVDIPYGIERIAPYTFYNCNKLESIVLPNSVTTIGAYAFSGCSGLTSVNIPNSVKSIGDSAFSICTNLTSITIPNSVTTIGAYAFAECSGLTSITIPDSVTSISDNAFSSCSGLTSIIIPNNVKTIGSSAFYNCSGLTSINIPDSVTSIGDNAFSGCSNLQTIVIGKGITSLPEGLLKGCINLENITIPFVGKSRAVSSYQPNGNAASEFAFGYIFGGERSTSKTSTSTWIYQGSSAYRNKPNYLNYSDYYYGYYIPQSLKTVIITDAMGISAYAFYGCSMLTSITIPDSVTRIGNSTFYNCTELASITIPNSVTNIGTNAFYNCPIETATMPTTAISSIPKSSVNTVVITSGESIGASAFSGFTGLTAITIPNSVTSIGNNAFDGCDSLTTIYYNGSISGWCSISGLNNMPSIEHSLYINDAIIGGRLEFPNEIKTLEEYVFYMCTNLTSVIICSNTKLVKSYAFYGCSGLETVTIPVGIKRIEDYAFDNCDNLTTIIYDGTIDQWNALNWTPPTTVNVIHCSDGNINL